MKAVQIFSPFFAYSKVKIGGYKPITPKKRLQKSRETRNTCRSRLAGDGLQCAAFILVTRVIVNDHRWQASSYKDRILVENPAKPAIPVGAGLPAMHFNAPRLSWLPALSFTTIAGKPAPTRTASWSKIPGNPQYL
ncbi:hypothetical protein [Pseudomonas sp. PB101]|uniref:hypothetical protein n=1 Tax=Pseudomonas sp. PB101 TaxID=2495428 RepID=UPI00136543F4|nr:hypothetical protein [Pseudomonas sp. PB101]